MKQIQGKSLWFELAGNSSKRGLQLSRCNCTAVLFSTKIQPFCLFCSSLLDDKASYNCDDENSTVCHLNIHLYTQNGVAFFKTINESDRVKQQ